MKFLNFAFAFFLTITCLISNAQQGQAPTANTDSIKNKWQDIAYANISQAQKLDIYLPNDGKGPFPSNSLNSWGCF